LATVVLLGAGCNINGQITPITPNNTSTSSTEETNTTTTGSTQSENTQPVNSDSTTTNTASPITYTNQEFHFSLTLPATWAGYTAKTTENKEGGKSIWFGFAGWDNILSIGVYPTEIDNANTKYYGTDGQVYYYGGQSQYIKIDSLQPRWDEASGILNSFTVANLTNGTENWKVYANTDYNFQIKYPTKYKEIADTYGWKNAVVLFLEDKPGVQSYAGSISIWNNIEDYRNDTTYSAMAYSYKKVGNKYVVINYFSYENNINLEWQKVIDSFKTIN